MKNNIPNPLLWTFESYDLKNKNFLKDLEFIKNNTCVNHITISVRNGVELQNLQQCHGVMKELVKRAHELGLKVSLHFTDSKGFYNAIFQTNNIAAVDQIELFPIPDPEKAAALVNDIELITDEEGFASYSYAPRWARKKIMPIYSEILKVYSFEKTAEGFYKSGTLEDVTDKIIITESRTNRTSFEINLGKQNKNKSVFVLLAQYFNYPSVADAWEGFKKLFDAYSDIPLDGIQLDEYGYLFLNTSEIHQGNEPAFRGRHYSKGMEKYYREKLGLELARVLFNMRYAPENNEKIRIKAINTYFETLRVFPLEIEKKAYNYAKKLFGENAYINCHNTFHNSLEGDEIWRTACNWWDIPRDYGHTDENIGFPIRWGVMLSRNNPIMFDMFYAKDKMSYYALQNLCSVLCEDYEVCEMPAQWSVFESIRMQGSDINPVHLHHFSFKKDNGSFATMYWMPKNILTETYEGTVSITLNDTVKDKEIKITDLLTGVIYKLDDKMTAQSGILRNIPVTDSPLMLTFGDFI